MWLGELRNAQGYLLGSLSQIFKVVKMWSWEERGGPFGRDCSRSKGLEERPGQGLEGQGGTEQAEKKKKDTSERRPVPRGVFHHVNRNQV